MKSVDISLLQLDICTLAVSCMLNQLACIKPTCSSQLAASSVTLVTDVLSSSRSKLRERILISELGDIATCAFLV